MMRACLIISAFGLFLGLVTEKKKLNPLLLFYGEWFIICLLSNLGLYGILQARDNTYGLIFLGLLFFLIGYYVLRYLKGREKQHEYVEREWLLVLLSVITLIVFIIDAAKTLPALISGQGLKSVRELAQGATIYSNSVLNMLRFIIAIPFSFALAVIAPVNYFLGAKRNYKLYVMAIIVIVLKILSDGSRTIFIIAACTCFICFMYVKSKSAEKIILLFRKKTWTGILLAIVTVVVIIYLTLSRSGAESVRYTYYYFAMEPIMLEKWTDEVLASGVLGMGAAATNGFWFVLFYILSNVFGIAPPSVWASTYSFIERAGTDWQVITTEGLTANSYVSIFFPFYIDGRECGVCIGMFVVGAIMAVSYRRAVHCVNAKSIALYSILMFALLNSFQLFIFENISETMCFIFLLMLYRERKTS